jgi:hypothetical protein
LAGAVRRFRYWVDTQPAFPDVYAKSGKWFRRVAELFRRRGRTKQSFQRFNDFNAPELTKWPGKVLNGPYRSLGQSFNGRARPQEFDARCDFLTFLWWKVNL